MDRTSDNGLDPRAIIRILRTHFRLWAVPAVVCTVLAAAYALVAPRDWRATQAMYVRPDAASVSGERLGKFSDLSEMKTLQETILELAKSPSVVAATLTEVGPPTSHSQPAEWPTPKDVEAFREQVDMRPPGGAEFGKTEVFYLSVLDTDRDRASRLADALCRQVEHRMQQLRDDRAKGMVTELERTVAMAGDDLAHETNKLSNFEAAVGPDLAELRNLNAEIGGQSEVAQELQSIETERRANESVHRENIQLLALLKLAQDDPRQLIAMPSRLLQSQPALSRLKDALVDAQVRTANLLGSLTEEHPYVIAAREAESLVRGRLREELAVAVKGLEVDLRLNADHEQVLAEQHEAGRARMARLAGARAEYANLVASVGNLTRLLEAARKNLADARAQQAGALSASVISRIDGVEAGIRPVGPSRTTISAAGGVAGLILGFGLVFLAVPVVATGGTPVDGS
jgi:succinoglycan biosynthesis transport protein ExoP